MDFFEHQEQARKRTHVLVFFFALAVTGIVLAIYALVLFIQPFLVEDADRQQAEELFAFWQPTTFAITAACALGVIFLASAFKTMSLAGGGKVVARELGGRKLDPNTTHFHERRLQNVVEEMAIASGVPVPEVYVMDAEDSINAFAAGLTTSDAVIGVTKGCMKLLTRDELQGVIAHEFSHILNGDMRLNIRLMGLLFGILFIALTGGFLLRNSWHVGGNSRSGGGIALLALAIGLGLMAIGYIGLFFARLIKASVSRQREYLADASAVQFTRNPDGLAGALRKIGGYKSGSRISNAMAQDASHLFFGNALRNVSFATHPPLEKRIRRLLPSWNGKFSRADLAPATEAAEPAPERQPGGRGGRGGRGPLDPLEPMMPGATLPGMMLDDADDSLRVDGREAAESMRTLHPEQVDLGRRIHGNLPEEWLRVAHDEAGAQALVFALLVSQDEKLCQSELSRLRSATDELTHALAARLHGEMRDLHSSVKLGLVDLCLPALRQLSPGDYQRFKSLLDELVASDGVVDLFEFALLRLVRRHLDTWFRQSRPPGIHYRRLAALREEASVLLSTLAAMSHPDDRQRVDEAFAAAVDFLREKTGTDIQGKPPEECGLDAVERAVDRFARATPTVKRTFLQACCQAVLTDGVLSSREAELIRAIADTMGCALPPFVKTAPLLE